MKPINTNISKRYALCLRLAAIFNSKYRYDIVHDAFLYFYEKRGESIFEIPLRDEAQYLYTVIKHAFYRWYYRERRSPDKYTYVQAEDTLMSKAVPSDDILVGKELYSKLLQQFISVTLPSEHVHYRTVYGRMLPIKIFELNALGYKQVDIANELQISKQLVNQYFNKLNGKALHKM